MGGARGKQSDSGYPRLLSELRDLIGKRGNESVALVLVHLDGLQGINDEFGYAGGDRVLEAFGERLARVARSNDSVLALGGPAFAFVISNPLHEGHAILGAERVARETEEPLSTGNGVARVRVHMGIALWPQSAEDADQLLRQCETALSGARRRDEDYLLFHVDQTIRHDGIQRGWFDVDEAMKAGEFEMHYQPKLALQTGRLCGAEALVRWQKPGSGLVPPGSFLPAIEQTRGVRALLNFTLNASLREAVEWCRARPDFTVAVNLSPGNLEDPDLVELVEDALGVWGFPARQLLLEITETALMSGKAASANALERLHDLGIRLAIDDFGTGYASLAYLRRIPARELKIDQSFVAPMLTSQDDREIVGAVISLGHALGLDVVAEGIEDGEVAQALRAMGCDIGQGYFLGRPLPAALFSQAWISGARTATSAG